MRVSKLRAGSPSSVRRRRILRSPALVSGLEEGEYELVLSLELQDGQVLTRSRTFRVVGGVRDED